MVKDEEKRKILEALIYLMEPYRIEAMQRYLSEIPKNRELTRKICDLADTLVCQQLNQEQKALFNDLMATMQDLHDVQLSAIYTAGIIDGVVFLKDQGLLDKVIANI